MGNALVDGRGNFYWDVYYIPISFELFKDHVKAELRLRGLPKVSPQRMKRLFDVYRYIIRNGRVVWQNETSDDFKLYVEGEYDGISHHAILSDFHVLESVGLLFRRGESISDGRILQFRELVDTPKYMEFPAEQNH
ncbi:MAG: hypothetical protein IJQ34_00995 [Kiritimatiellae bacterium]|nr:hypothetical protein [Kiritimatiellia bacterium]